MPCIGISILNTALGVIFLSVIQKVDYDHAMDDQKKAVQAFLRAVGSGAAAPLFMPIFFFPYGL